MADDCRFGDPPGQSDQTDPGERDQRHATRKTEKLRSHRRTLRSRPKGNEEVIPNPGNRCLIQRQYFVAKKLLRAYAKNIVAARRGLSKGNLRDELFSAHSV